MTSINYRAELGISGFNVGADEESGHYWPTTQWETLPLIGRLVVERPSQNAEDGIRRRVTHEARRLPDGDVMVRFGNLSWTRLTSDRDRIQDYRARYRIVGHRYTTRLADALIHLEKHGRCPGLVYSWLGGSGSFADLRTTGFVRSFSGGKTATAEEKLARLRDYLREVAEVDWPGAKVAAEALEYAQEGSIEAVVDPDREPDLHR